MVAKNCVYQALHKLLPSTVITDKTQLADIGYDDNISKDIIRAAINREKCHSPPLKKGALNGCSSVADIIKIP